MFDSDEEAVNNPVLGGYDQILSSSAAMDFVDFDEIPLLSTEAKDVEGRPVIIITTNCVPSKLDEQQRITSYVVRRIDPIVSRKPYTVVVCFSRITWNALADPGYLWIKECTLSKRMSMTQKRNPLFLLCQLCAMLILLMGLIITICCCFCVSVKPTPKTATLTASTPFIPARFWGKFVNTTTLAEVRNKLLVPPAHSNRVFCHIVQNVEAQAQGQEPPLVFGARLAELADWQGRDLRGCQGIPETLVRLVKALAHPNVITTRDLFYHQPDAPDLYSTIQSLQEGDWQPDLTLNVAATATALRVFLESLPSPLLGSRAFDQFAALAKSTNYGEDLIAQARYLSVLNQVIGSVSPVDQQTIRFLLLFFDGVVEKQKQNMMTPKKLSECFAPAFVRPHLWTPLTPRVLPTILEAITLLIEKSHSVFPDLLPQHDELTEEEYEEEDYDESGEEKDEEEEEKAGAESSDDEEDSSYEDDDDEEEEDLESESEEKDSDEEEQ